MNRAFVDDPREPVTWVTVLKACLYSVVAIALAAAIFVVAAALWLWKIGVLA